jgi:protein SCO1/2
VGVQGDLSTEARAGPLEPATLAKLTFEQKLNMSLPLQERFHDENGASVKLGDYFGEQPAILVLGYYTCPMLCNSVLNGLVKSIDDLKLTAGKDFSVIFASIDPSETPALAAAKRKTYLRHYDRPRSEQGWHFLTGEEPAIHRLAVDAGFSYAFDPVARQYAHPSGLIVVTPEGKISKYFFGVSFPSKDLNEALIAASKRHISSPIQQFLLLCFHYNPVTGKYGTLILNLVRVFGVATMLGLGALVFSMSGRKPAVPAPSTPLSSPRQAASAKP